MTRTVHSLESFREPREAVRRGYFSIGTNFTQTGSLTVTVLPVSLPAAGRRVDLLRHADLAAVLAGDQHPLAGRVDVEVPRGLDVAGDVPGGGELVVLALTLNTAMLLCPRLDTYTNLPSGERMHSAVEFPLSGFGSVRERLHHLVLVRSRSRSRWSRVRRRQ